MATLIRILGIDPGLQHTGWGIIESDGHRIKYIASGVCHSKAEHPMPDRLLAIQTLLSEAITRHQPVEAAMEETFVNKNAMSSLKLGHARGALMLTVALAGLPLAEYAATVVKKTVTGKGRAEKEQVQGMLQYVLPGTKITNPDEADALAVALCHAYHLPVRKLRAL